MQAKQQLVYIVDDDDAVRDSLHELLSSVGITSLEFRSAVEFFDQVGSTANGILVLDVRMPEMSGLDMQLELNRRGYNIPVIFITGHGDVPMAVKAMKNGAIDFLQKPFRDQDLLDKVQTALSSNEYDDQDGTERARVLEAIATLTPREKQTLDMIANGYPSKVIAAELGISPRTVEKHRAQVLRKLNARSTAALIKLALLAEAKI